MQEVEGWKGSASQQRRQGGEIEPSGESLGQRRLSPKRDPIAGIEPQVAMETARALAQSRESIRHGSIRGDAFTL